MYEFWRERESGRVWAVELRDGIVRGACGPLRLDQISRDYLRGYAYADELGREIEGRRAEFDLLTEEALLLYGAQAD